MEGSDGVVIHSRSPTHLNDPAAAVARRPLRIFSQLSQVARGHMSTQVHALSANTCDCPPRACDCSAAGQDFMSLCQIVIVCACLSS